MSSSSREKILSTIRGQRVPAGDLPELAGPWIEYPDREQQFGEALAFVGGKLERVANLAELRARLAELPAFLSARQICSGVPGAVDANVNLDDVTDPHELESVDLAVMPGEFAVAENGAIWVKVGPACRAGLDSAPPTQPVVVEPRHRVIYFLTQHLVLVVPAAELVHNMYEAYQRITFAGPSFGVFISGPSKTADIEQSLVIGAHGARSLTVFLVG